MPSIFDQDLPRNAANFAPLSPLSFIERTAEIYPRRLAVVHGIQHFFQSMPGLKQVRFRCPNRYRKHCGNLFMSIAIDYEQVKNRAVRSRKLLYQFE